MHILDGILSAWILAGKKIHGQSVADLTGVSPFVNF